MLAVARSRAAELGVTNVEFVEADAQTYACAPAAADVVMSRFGVMFFDDAPAAFANLGRALTPGGRIGFVSWRPLVDNEWLLIPGAAAAAHVEIPSAETAADAPGMFSLSDPDGQRTLAVDAVRATFATHYEPDAGVRMGAAGWMVSGVKR